MLNEVTQEFLRDWYDSEAERNSQAQIYRVAHARRRMQTVKSMLSNYVHGAYCLDVGCGEGLYSHWMAECGAAHVLGIDISPINIERARAKGNPNRVHFECMSWDDINDLIDVYDLVLATEVFEHAVNPQSLADKCITLGRRLIATAPISEPDVPADPFKVQGHLHCFRIDSFSALFGSHVTRVSTDGIYAYVIAEQ